MLPNLDFFFPCTHIAVREPFYMPKNKVLKTLLRLSALRCPVRINQSMPYQKFRLIDIHSLCHREWFYDCHVIFPRSIKEGLEPVFNMAVLSFKRAWQVFFWEPKFEGKRMFAKREDWVGTDLARSCQEMQKYAMVIGPRMVEFRK